MMIPIWVMSTVSPPLLGDSGSATSGTMRVISWSSCGIGSVVAGKELRKLCFDFYPSIIYICESKLTRSSSISNIEQLCNFNNVCAVHPVGRSGELLLYWKNYIRIDVVSFPSAHVDVVLRHNKEKLSYLVFTVILLRVCEINHGNSFTYWISSKSTMAFLRRFQ